MAALGGAVDRAPGVSRRMQDRIRRGLASGETPRMHGGSNVVKLGDISLTRADNTETPAAEELRRQVAARGFRSKRIQNG